MQDYVFRKSNWHRGTTSPPELEGVDGLCQTAYEVRTEKNGVSDWESGKVETAAMACAYGGNLQSRDCVRWSVRLYELSWRDYMIRAAADKSIYQMPDGHPMKAMMGPFLLGDTPYAKFIVESGAHWGEWSEPAGVLDHDIKQKRPMTAGHSGATSIKTW